MFVEINQPNWNLVIVSDDAIKLQNRNKLELLIKELKAEDMVILSGSQKKSRTILFKE